MRLCIYILFGRVRWFTAIFSDILLSPAEIKEAFLLWLSSDDVNIKDWAYICYAYNLGEIGEMVESGGIDE